MSFVIKPVNAAIDSVSNYFSTTWNAISHPNYEQIDADLKIAEKYLNKAGYIPGVSLVSGQLRELLGYTEILAGLFFAIVHQLGANFTSGKEAKERLYKQAEIDFSYFMNGVGNVIRGKVEQVPLWAVSALFYSKLILVAYDTFSFRLNYGHEEPSESRFPLLRFFDRQKGSVENEKYLLRG